MPHAMRRAYGWVRSRPDFRDHPFAAAGHLLRALPPQIDLAATPAPAPYDPPWQQGELGACGPFAAAADVVYAALRQDLIEAPPLPSTLFVYWVTRYLMGTVQQDSGVDNRTMLRAIAKFGWCDEQTWPYGQDYRKQPPKACFDQAASRKIQEYLAVPQQIDQMRGCLAGGDPFILGFSVYESLESDAVDATGVVPMPSRSDRQVGGHDVLVVGYDDARRCFKFRNSWGSKWGQGGYGWIPYAYAIDPQLAADFWTVRHSALSPGGPKPPLPSAARTIVVRGGTIEVDGQAV